MSPTLTVAVKRTLRAVLAGALAFGLVLAIPAARPWAQSLAPDMMKSVVLAEPGVFFVGTEIRICVRTKFSYQTNSTHCYQQTWSGSGFGINPDGLIATASHVVKPDAQERMLLRNYATNRALLEEGRIALDPTADLEQRYVQTDPARDFDLQGCYRGDLCEFTLSADVQVFPAVQVAGVSTPKPLPATVLAATGFEKTDVAILQAQVDSPIPTLPLAASIADVESLQPVVALGFPGAESNLPTGMTEPTKSVGWVSNIRAGAAGTGTQIQVSNINLRKGTSGSPLLGNDGKVIGLISYSTLDEEGPGDDFVRSVDDIRVALKAAGKEAERGELDARFEQAMGYFWDHHYSAAVPLYQKVLNLYDGHPLAKKYLAKAQAKANGPDDVPLAAENRDKGRVDLLRVAALIGAALLVVVLLLLLVVFGRRHARSVDGRRKAAPTGGRRVETADWSVPNAATSDAGAAGALPGSTAGPAADGGSSEDGSAFRAVGIAVAAPERSDADGFEPVAPETHRFCPYCGSGLAQGSRFCSACGQQVR